jgi:hypothetical protein
MRCRLVAQNSPVPLAVLQIGQAKDEASRVSLEERAEKIQFLEHKLATMHNEHLRATSQASTLEETVQELRMQCKEREEFLEVSQDRVVELTSKFAKACAELEQMQVQIKVKDLPTRALPVSGNAVNTKCASAHSAIIFADALNSVRLLD